MSRPYGGGFESKSVRTQFVRKVFTILAAQLALTAMIIVYISTGGEWMVTSTFVKVISNILFFASYYAILCCEGPRRQFPLNFGLLAIFTITMAISVGTTTIQYTHTSVLYAFGLCAACCAAVAVFSYNTKYDVTQCGGIMLVMLMGLLGSSLILMVWPSELGLKLYAIGGSILFLMYLAHDIQMIMGGRSIEVDPEEYVFAALMIYVDVINIFLDILRLVGEERESES